jgi:Ca-activated chloride channel family protein
MTASVRRRAGAIVTAMAAAAVALSAQEPQTPAPGGQGFSFRSGVELIAVTATVTDANGRFVPNLRADDFVVTEDGKPQKVQQFDAERVPVSLGIALDTSGSMLGEKIQAAEDALNRFLFKLLGPDDEVFLYRFDSRPELVQSWTTDRQAVSRALGSVRPSGGTAIYDTVAEAVPLAKSGTRRKKALVILSDGNDTSSHIRLDDLHQLIRESEVLVYAIGIDASGDSGGKSSKSSGSGSTPPTAAPGSHPVPSPFPGKKPVYQPPAPAPAPPSAAPKSHSPAASGRMNEGALRAITDDSGGRTEIIVSSRDIDPATAGIAAELNQQYFLGYVSSIPKDGRWHTIDVQVRRGNYTVRARKGFIAN